MTTQRDLERALHTFFELGANEVADRVIDGALLTIEHTQQRRAMRVPWRFTDMPSAVKLAAIAAAVVLAVGGAIWMLGRGSGPGVGGQAVASAPPSATPSPAPTPSPTPPPPPSPTPVSTTGWVTFTSNRYGYQIAHPPAFRATPGSRDWTIQADLKDVFTSAVDQFIDPAAAYQINVFAFAVDVSSNTTEDQWIASFYAGWPAGCGLASPDIRTISVDGHPGRLYVNDSCADAEAFVFLNGRVHVFAVWRDKQIPLLEAFLSTVKFPASPPPSGSPAGSASPSASPS